MNKQRQRGFDLKVLGTVVLVCGSLAACAAAPKIGSEDTLNESHLSAIIAACFQMHVAKAELTPELAAATLSNYVEMLDYGKVYLLQSDVDEAYANRLRIPQAYEKGEWSFVTGLYARFLQRVEEQTSNVVTYLGGQSFNLETNRTIVVDPKKMSFPATSAEARRRLDDSLQYQVAYLVSIGETLTGAVQKVERRRIRFSNQYHDFKHRDRLGVFLNAFCRALDPHTAYLSFDDMEDFQINMSLSLQGIGAVLSSEEGVTVIKSMTPGGPADKSGQVKPEDMIMAVAQGKSDEFVDIYDMDLRDVVKKVRGKKGTVVRLKIVRKGDKGADNKLVTLTRDEVKLEDQAARMEYVNLVRTNAAGVARNFKFAVIDLPSFYADPKEKELFGKSTRSAVADMRRFLRASTTAGVDGVVLDMQRNGGGLLEEAVDVAGLFFRKGNVVMARDRRNENSVLADEDAAIEFGGPVVVTVSRATASGAEIVAGALQDYRRALVVGGDHTYGKGTIQQFCPLPGKLGSLKVTVGEYFIASGRSPQHRGVIPDIILPSELSAVELGERYEPSALPARVIDDQLSNARSTGLDEHTWEVVGSNTAAHLSLQSRQRVTVSPEFKKIEESVAKIRKEREKDRVVIASLLQNVSTNKPGVANGGMGTGTGLDEEPAATSATRAPITNDLVVLEAVQILADWVTADPAAKPVVVPPAATNISVQAVQPTMTTNTPAGRGVRSRIRKLFGS